MFRKGDHVFYSGTGVCQITDIRPARLGGQDEQDFYLLKPVTNPALTLYVPVHQAGLDGMMRPVLTRDEIMALIESMPGQAELRMETERERGQEYAARLRSCDSQDLVRLVKTLYRERQERKGSARAQCSNDTKVLGTAEKLLHDEIAFVLGLQPKEVVPFIARHVAQAAG